MDLSPTGFYKVLRLDGLPYHGGQGPVYQVGKKRSVRGALVPCKNGIHICTADQLVWWLGPAIYPVVSVSEEHYDAGDKTVARWVILGDPYLTTWTLQTMRLFACDCAERVLSIYEQRFPDDTRPQYAIAVARRFARGDATVEELADAARAARAAADDAYVANAYVAARAAYVAVDTAVAHAYIAPAYAATSVASVASAAHAAANAAATATAPSAREDERGWQTQRLMQYITGELP